MAARLGRLARVYDRGAMPLVSILIPAYRATWLNQAIASAISQTFIDFELLISDDSADDKIEQLVAEWSDSRIKYFRNPKRGTPGSNRDHLISRARGEYLKFLFDDDLLYPRSVETLVTIMQKTGCRLAFHSRDVISEDNTLLERMRFDRVSEKIGWYQKERRRISLFLDSKFPDYSRTSFFRINPKYFFYNMIGKVANRIGEPTALLIHSPTLHRLSSPFQIGQHRLRFLTDMALFANFFQAGVGVAGTSWVGAAVRRHAAQTSGRAYPGYSAGLFEWDLLGRWAFDLGSLPYDKLLAQHDIVMTMYERDLANYPELSHFVELPIGLENAPLAGARFDQAQQLAYQAIDNRRARLMGGGVC